MSEYVMVRRNVLQDACSFDDGIRLSAQHAIEALLADQHQGEPVVLPAERTRRTSDDRDEAWDNGWNACLDEIAKLGPLYTHADPGEVERLREGRKLLLEELELRDSTVDALRAQLAERDALLVDISKRHWSGVDFDLPADLVDRIKALTASAEPSAPEFKACSKCIDAYSCSLDGCQFGPAPKPVEHSAPVPMPAYMEAACDKFDWTPEEALRFYAEGKHFDVVAGRTRILCTGAIASHALKGIGGEYADMKGIEPRASAERDERAAFNSWLHEVVLVSGSSGRTNKVQRMDTLTRTEEEQAWVAWQARAALERKP